MDLRIETGQGFETDLKTELVIGTDGDEWMRFYYTEQRYGFSHETDVFRCRLTDFTNWIQD